VNSRHSILRGQKPNASHFAALQQADATLRNVCDTIPPSTASQSAGSFPQQSKRARKSGRLDDRHCDQRYGLTIEQQELMAMTDAYIDNTLRAADAAQGKWLNEDPSLSQIQQIILSRR
jgi:hypothetical protein